MKFLSLSLFLLLTGMGSLSPCQAALLDWTGKTWNIGSSNNQSFMQNTYALDGTAGNTVTITISHTLSYNPFAPYPTTQPTPQVGTRHAGGLNPIDEALQLHMDFQNRGEFVLVNFAFAQPLAGLNFTIFDIDNASSFQDQLTFQGALDGITSTALVNNLGSAVRQGPNTPQGATVLSGVANAPDTYGSNPGTTTGTQAQTGNGNGSVGFVGNINNLTLRYSAGDRGPANPSTQGISIYDINYLAAVPEVNTAWVAAFCCVGAALFQWRRKRLISESSPS